MKKVNTREAKELKAAGRKIMRTRHGFYLVERKGKNEGTEGNPKNG